MAYKIFIILYFGIILASFSQKKDIDYEVDGILVDPIFYEELNDLTDSIVHQVIEIDDPVVLKQMGYDTTERLLQVFTKAYHHRPDSLLQIPSTKQMERIEGKWHLKNNPVSYSGEFRDYYLTGKLQGKGSLVDGKLEGTRWLYYKDGQLSELLNYKNGFPEGEEFRYYPDGTLRQTGYYKEGYETGEWKKFHPNGQLQQVSFFEGEGLLQGEVRSYYSTGELKGVSYFEKGQRIESATDQKISQAYELGKESFRKGNFKEAIQQFSFCIKKKPTWNDAYFARGTAYLNHFEFDKALEDFNKAIAIEPLDAYAYTNRAFVLIRKKEWEDAKQKGKDATIELFGYSEVSLSEEERNAVCQDLSQAERLGDDSRMRMQVKQTYCK